MSNLVKIHLGGKLGKIFGQEWDLYVSSPAEALRAINVNTKGGFFKYLRIDGNKKFYKIAVQNKKNTLTEKEILSPTGKGDIFITPIVGGKSSGTAKVIAGVILIAIAYYWDPSGSTAQAIASSMFSSGVSLILGGIVQLITPVPTDAEPDQDDELRSSDLFRGNATAITQGGCVGMVYGRAIVAPMPISISLNSYDKIIYQPPVIPETPRPKRNTFRANR
jgi:predicted phage tail protein